jgi:hypothetical protein
LDDETALVVPSCSVTVRDVTGATVYTGDAAKSETDESWSVQIPAQPLGVYTVEWVGGTVATDTNPFEVVGTFLFSLPEARDSDIDLEDTVRFPTSELRHYRDVVEAEFERITGRSFTTRSKRVKLTADGSSEYYVGVLDLAAVTAAVGPSGVADVSLWTVDPLGFVQTGSSLADGDVYTLTVTYGMPIADEDVKRAGLLRLRSLLTAERSGIPDRATAFVAHEGGNFTLATPGRGGYETGIPEVDATLARFRFRMLDGVA